MITVTLEDGASRDAEMLHRAFLHDAVVAFRGDRVRVLREHVERADSGLRWMFDLEVLEE